MYRIEFRKENLEANDYEIGEVVFQPLFKNKVFVGFKVKGVLCKTGSEFSSKGEAENVANKFKELYTPFPNTYKVTTEVYKVPQEVV